MPQKVGLFGGTFDPPHIGHLTAALNAHHGLSLDRVLFVVANVPWQKVGERRISDTALRLAMTEAAVADVDGFEVSTIEIDRGGSSYTIDTVEALLAGQPDLDIHLVVGTDVADSLHTWHRHEELRALVSLAIIERPGSVGADPPGGWTVNRVQAPLVDLSSTELRARLADGRPVKYLVPDAVERLWRYWPDRPGAVAAGADG